MITGIGTPKSQSKLLDRGRNAGTSGKVPADRRDEDFGTGGHTIQRARFLVPPCG